MLRYAIPLLLLAGCQQYEPWHGSTSFTLEQRAKIQAGYDFACQKTHDEKCLPIVWDADPSSDDVGTIINARPVPGAHTVIDGSTDTNNLGEYKDGRVWIAADFPNLKRLSAHEFGHALGLHHSRSGEHAMMMPDPLSSGEDELVWTDADEEMLRHRNAARD